MRGPGHRGTNAVPGSLGFPVAFRIWRIIRNRTGNPDTPQSADKKTPNKSLFSLVSQKKKQARGDLARLKTFRRQPLCSSQAPQETRAQPDPGARGAGFVLPSLEGHSTPPPGWGQEKAEEGSQASHASRPVKQGNHSVTEDHCGAGTSNILYQYKWHFFKHAITI